MTEETTKTLDELAEPVIQLQPIYVAKGIDVKVQWSYLQPMDARMGFLNLEENHKFPVFLNKSLIDNYARIFHLSAIQLDKPYEESLINIIEGFEVRPSTEGQEEFSKYRLKWVQLYFEAICELEGESFENFIPRMQFKPHMEGPLIGYLRAIENLTDEKQKMKLLEYLNPLQAVPWYTEYKDNRATDFYYIIKGETLNERILSFILGGWSAMVTLIMKDPSEMAVQFIKLGEEFFGNENLTDKQKQLIGQTIELLTDLTFPPLDLLNAAHQQNIDILPRIGFFIETSRIFATTHAKVRHMFYNTNKTQDFEYTDEQGKLVDIPEGFALWRYKDQNADYAKFLKLSVEN